MSLILIIFCIMLKKVNIVDLEYYLYYHRVYIFQNHGPRMSINPTLVYKRIYKKRISEVLSESNKQVRCLVYNSVQHTSTKVLQLLQNTSEYRQVIKCICLLDLQKRLIICRPKICFGDIKQKRHLCKSHLRGV